MNSSVLVKMVQNGYFIDVLIVGQHVCTIGVLYDLLDKFTENIAVDFVELDLTGSGDGG